MPELKHIGRMKNTKRKVLVAYRTLPGESDAALIIQTENLTPDQHDSIIKLVESDAGQSSYEFAEALARARFSDGSIMLSNLHINKRLVKVKTSDVEMMPNMHTSISLDQLNEIIAEQRNVSVNDLALGNDVKVKVEEVGSIQDVPEFNAPESELQKLVQVIEQKTVKSAEDYRQLANQLMDRANELYSLADELSPPPVSFLDEVKTVDNVQILENIPANVQVLDEFPAEATNLQSTDEPVKVEKSKSSRKK